MQGQIFLLQLRDPSTKTQSCSCCVRSVVPGRCFVFRQRARSPLQSAIVCFITNRPFPPFAVPMMCHLRVFCVIRDNIWLALSARGEWPSRSVLCSPLPRLPPLAADVRRRACLRRPRGQEPWSRSEEPLCSLPSPLERWCQSSACASMHCPPHSRMPEKPTQRRPSQTMMALQRRTCIGSAVQVAQVQPRQLCFLPLAGSDRARSTVADGRGPSQPSRTKAATAATRQQCSATSGRIELPRTRLTTERRLHDATRASRRSSSEGRESEMSLGPARRSEAMCNVEGSDRRAHLLVLAAPCSGAASLILSSRVSTSSLPRSAALLSSPHAPPPSAA